MTLIRDITFPNTPLTAYQEDPAEFDTEVVEGASGRTFRNGRRTVGVANYRITLQDLFSSATIAMALAVKAAAQGQLYGFKFVPPTGDGTPVDVAFKDDGWAMTIGQTPDTLANAQTTVTVQLEEVIDGVPAP
jgi:hypothetical protein